MSERLHGNERVSKKKRPTRPLADCSSWVGCLGMDPLRDLVMNTLIAIDPGTTHSAICFYSPDSKCIDARIGLNKEILNTLKELPKTTTLYVEMIASYGMPVGEEVFRTCVWIGRFIEAWGGNRSSPIYRKDVKMHLCHSMKANDSTIRQAIIDRYGGKEKAIGKKKTPGPLYGLSGDMWSALAVAITASETI